jgi:hypothetical protein
VLPGVEEVRKILTFQGLRQPSIGRVLEEAEPVKYRGRVVTMDLREALKLVLGMAEAVSIV